MKKPGRKIELKWEDEMKTFKEILARLWTALTQKESKFEKYCRTIEEENGIWD